MKHIQLFEDFANEKRGLWANIHAKRKRGEAPAKPGDKGYPSQNALKAAQANEMASSDIHYREIMDLYHSGSFAKKKVGSVVCKNPNATQKQIEAELSDSGYEDMIEFIEALGIKESYYAFLGGNSNFTDDEMRKNVVDKVLGKDYDAYIDFDETAPKGEYDKMKEKYASDTKKWETIWRSASYQGEALLSPDKKIIKARVFARGGIIGAIYVKKGALREAHEDLQNYMFFSNLESIKRKCESILAMDFKAIDEMLNAGGHDWAADHITVAKENIDQVENFLVGQFEDDKEEIPTP